ncbi:MAG TPA: LysR family transcriptional regulator, partial [Elusimicrobia bacterium]|nr:LysR family transcriptional regulator [Elusimicrobiota bacterium]
MDLRTLEIFTKLAENESFSQTAEELHLTQPTISFQIHSLEKYYGVKLFQRTTRELFLTAEGKILNEYAKKIINLNRQVQEAMNEVNGLKRGELTLGASTIPGEYILLARLKSFQRKFPQIKISLKIADTEEIIEEVLEKKLDLGVVGSKIKHRDLVYEQFAKDKIVLIAQGKTKVKNFNLEDLKKQPILLREKGSGTRKTMLEALAKENIYLEDLNIIMELGSTEAIKSAVET